MKPPSCFCAAPWGCLVDGRQPSEVQDILNSEMYFFKLRRDDAERIIRTMANYFPPFGLIGSIVGLVAMMANVDDSSVILASVPIALTSTLYGLVFSNFFFLPFAANLSERTSQELLLQRMILEGVPGHSERDESPSAGDQTEVISHSLDARRKDGFHR